MPRSRLIARIDQELMQARVSLKFWRDQMLMLDDRDLQVTAKRLVTHREGDITRLLETQEMLHDLDRGAGPTTS